MHQPTPNHLITTHEHPLMPETTCAVHTVLMEGLQDQIGAIDSKQEEVKDLILNAHKESLNHIQVSAERNRTEIDKLTVKLDDEITKFHERDREYLISINDLKIKHAIYSALATGVAITLSGLISAFRVADIIIN